MINLRQKWYYHTEEKSCNDTISAKELGITWRKGVVQNLGDQTWFFDCGNVPEKLPQGWSVLEGELESFIGHGLSWNDVKELKNIKGN